MIEKELILMAVNKNLMVGATFVTKQCEKIKVTLIGAGNDEGTTLIYENYLPPIEVKGEDVRHEKCKVCGESWNVSIFMETPENGYICPNCRNEIKKIKEKRNAQSKLCKNSK